MFTIDKGVPIPLLHSKLSPMQDAIDQLEIGDSFFVASAKPKSTIVLAHKCALRAHVKCTTRNSIEGGIAGVRIWRVE